MANIIDIDLPDQLGEVAVSQRLNVFKQLIYTNNDIWKIAAPLGGDVVDEQPLLVTKMGDVMQKGNTGAFTPKGDFSITGGKLKVRDAKLDLLFTDKMIAQARRTYAGQVKMGKINPTELPFADWLYNMIVDRYAANIADCFVNGVYDADPANLSHLTAMNGKRKLITDAITANVIPADNRIATGVIDATNAVAQLHKFIDKVISNVHLTGEKMIIGLAPALRRAYQTDYRSLWSGQPGVNKEGVTLLDNDDRFELRELAWLTGSSRVAMTIEGNFQGDATEVRPITIETVDRNIKVFADTEIALGFSSGEYVWTNTGTGVS